jgi:hypothetical protein
MFALCYQRANVLDNARMIEVEPAFKDVMEEKGALHAQAHGKR